jgi:hypothetical protein
MMVKTEPARNCEFPQMPTKGMITKISGPPNAKSPLGFRVSATALPYVARLGGCA